MNIIEPIRKYISELDCMKTFENVVNVNYLSDTVDSFSIEEVPSKPIIKEYIDGSTIRQFQFIFTSREPYSAEVLQNIENSNFYEDFSDEIERKNRQKILPILDGAEAKNLTVSSSAYTISVTEDTAIYQINLILQYYKGVE